MREFFKGWRRKTGCVTLAMALLLTVGWVRSQSREDMFSLSHGTNICFVGSGDGRIWWSRAIIPIYYEPLPLEFNWESQRIDRASESPDWGFSKLSWMAPYYSIVVPLTLLSAYLLLGKPRPKKSAPKPAKPA